MIRRDFFGTVLGLFSSKLPFIAEEPEIHLLSNLDKIQEYVNTFKRADYLLRKYTICIQSHKDDFTIKAPSIEKIEKLSETGFKFIAEPILVKVPFSFNHAFLLNHDNQLVSRKNFISSISCYPGDIVKIDYILEINCD